MKHKSKKQRKAIRNHCSGTDEPRYRKGQNWREEQDCKYCINEGLSSCVNCLNGDMFIGNTVDKGKSD